MLILSVVQFTVKDDAKEDMCMHGPCYSIRERRNLLAHQSSTATGEIFSLVSEEAQRPHNIPSACKQRMLANYSEYLTHGPGA